VKAKQEGQTWAARVNPDSSTRKIGGQNEFGSLRHGSEVRTSAGGTRVSSWERKALVLITAPRRESEGSTQHGQSTWEFERPSSENKKEEKSDGAVPMRIQAVKEG